MVSDAQISPRRRTRSHRREDGDGSNLHSNLRATDIDTSYKIQEEVTSTRMFPIRSLFGFVIHAVVCASWLLYLGLRLQMCLRASASNSRLPWTHWLFFVCELILAGPDLFQIIELSLLFMPAQNPAPRPSYRLNGNDAPSVHVFITYAICYNE